MAGLEGEALKQAETDLANQAFVALHARLQDLDAFLNSSDGLALQPQARRSIEEHRNLINRRYLNCTVLLGRRYTEHQRRLSKTKPTLKPLRFSLVLALVVLSFPLIALVACFVWWGFMAWALLTVATGLLAGLGRLSLRLLKRTASRIDKFMCGQ